MEDVESSETNLSQIELLEALGHPLRIRILELLNEEPLSFSELKRKVGIKSSGHLQFHLNKLGKLIATSIDGNYMLTDDGKEALRMLKTVKISHKNLETSQILMFVLIANTVILAIVLVYAAGTAYEILKFFEGTTRAAGGRLPQLENSLFLFSLEFMFPTLVLEFVATFLYAFLSLLTRLKLKKVKESNQWDGIKSWFKSIGILAFVNFFAFLPLILTFLGGSVLLQAASILGTGIILLRSVKYISS
ncbi:MAG: winged helix-turn-helix domain-containing protein [Thermoproteota archaeon]